MDCRTFARMSEDECWKATRWAVEATSYEHLEIWNEWNKTNDWVQGPGGWLNTIAELYVGTEIYNCKKMPVCVRVYWDIVNGHPIAFYDACSMVTHCDIVDKYLDSKVKRHTNAMNFHQCAHDLGLKYGGKHA